MVLLTLEEVTNIISLLNITSGIFLTLKLDNFCLYYWFKSEIGAMFIVLWK